MPVTCGTSITHPSARSTPTISTSSRWPGGSRPTALGLVRIQARGHPLMVNGVLYTTGEMTIGRRARCRHRRAAVGALRARRCACAASPRQLSGRGKVLVRWTRGAHSLRHDRLPTNRTRRKNRQPHPSFARGHRRSEGGIVFGASQPIDPEAKSDCMPRRA